MGLVGWSPFRSRALFCWLGFVGVSTYRLGGTMADCCSSNNGGSVSAAAVHRHRDSLRRYAMYKSTFFFRLEGLFRFALL